MLRSGTLRPSKLPAGGKISPIPYVQLNAACAHMYYSRDARKHSRGQTLIAPHQLGGVQR